MWFKIHLTHLYGNKTDLQNILFHSFKLWSDITNNSEQQNQKKTKNAIQEFIIVFL